MGIFNVDNVVLAIVIIAVIIIVMQLLAQLGGIFAKPLEWGKKAGKWVADQGKAAGQLVNSGVKKITGQAAREEAAAKAAAAKAAEQARVAAASAAASEVKDVGSKAKNVGKKTKKKLGL